MMNNSDNPGAVDEPVSSAFSNWLPGQQSRWKTLQHRDLGEEKRMYGEEFEMRLELLVKFPGSQQLNSGSL